MVKPQRIDFIDLSHYQVGLTINWPLAIKSGVKAVVHKATEGTGWTDPSYDPRRAEVFKTGLPYGGYHFARPTPSNARSEAQHFLSVAKPKPGDLVPTLDLEANDAKMSESQLTQWVADWWDEVYTALGVRKGLLYTQYPLDSVPKGVKLWVPRYNNDNRPPSVPKPFHFWRAWQFTNGVFGVPNVVPGVGRVDASTLRWGVGRLIIPQVTKPVPKPKPKPHPVPTPPPVPPKKKNRESEVHKLLRIARGQVGYHEGRSNGHWNNIQKFSPAVKGLEWSQGQPWCCTFVSWCAEQAGLGAYFPITASCAAAEAWWKARGQWSEYPAIGAQVIYGGGGHTGIVYNFDDTYIYTIEGNTNTNGSYEGDGVYLKKRNRFDSYVTGYGYPAIPGVQLVTADPHYYKKVK